MCRSKSLPVANMKRDATGWSIHGRLCQSPGRSGMDHHLADGLAQVSTKP